MASLPTAWMHRDDAHLEFSDEQLIKVEGISERAGERIGCCGDELAIRSIEDVNTLPGCCSMQRRFASDCCKHIGTTA